MTQSHVRTVRQKDGVDSITLTAEAGDIYHVMYVEHVKYDK